MTTQVIKFDHRELAAAELGHKIGDHLLRALADNDSASLVVSGGSSPVRLFERLSEMPLDWGNVTVVPSDERVVAVDHADSNAGMIRRRLLTRQAASARFVSLLPDSGGSLDSLDERLAQLTWPLTHVVLGMGADGHTASLFPTAPDIANTLNSEARVVLQQVPGLSSKRVSLTVRSLLNARHISLLVFGKDKLEVLGRALQPGPAAELPVRSILHQNQCPVNVYWAP